MTDTLDVRETAQGLRLWRQWLVAVILVVVGLLCLRSWTQPERLLPVGTLIRFDDFAFTVTGSREVVLGKGNEAKRYTVVSLKVHNQAKRVPYQFRRSLAILVDDKGIEHGVSPVGQKALDEARGTPDPLASPLPAGALATTDLVFEIPDGASNLRMRIGDSVMNAVDDLFLRKPRLLVK